MTDFFYQIVTDARNYQDKDTMESLYNLKLHDMKAWCEEQLDLAEIPKGFFRNAFMQDMFSDENGTSESYKLWRYIQDYVYFEVCYDDESEEEKAGGS